MNERLLSIYPRPGSKAAVPVRLSRQTQALAAASSSTLALVGAKQLPGTQLRRLPPVQDRGLQIRRQIAQPSEPGEVRPLRIRHLFRAFHQRPSSLMRPRDQRHQRCINFTRYWPAGLLHEAQFLTASPDRNWHRDHDLTRVLQLQGKHLGIAAKRHGKERTGVEADHDPLILQLGFDRQTFEYAARISGGCSSEPLCQLPTTLPDQFDGFT
jgi:hypothetical protein